MAELVVDSILVNYKDEGKGIPLICIHGWMHNLSSYSQLTDDLKSKYRIISIDLPNFGKSQVDETIYNLDDYGKFISKFIDKLGIDKYILVGHSMGGQIIINAVAKDYLKPEKIVLIATAGIRDRRKVYKLFVKLCSKVFRHITPKQLKNRFYKKIGSDYNSNLSKVHKKIIDEVLSSDIKKEASQIEIPSLLVFGTLDTSTPLWMGEELNNVIQGSKLFTIEKENHWLHQTSSEQVAKAMIGFIDEK